MTKPPFWIESDDIVAVRYWGLQKAVNADNCIWDYAHRLRQYTTIELAIEICKAYEKKFAKKDARRLGTAFGEVYKVY
jgi:hypothetical protein